MFDFRIIICADGTEIIDRNLKTSYSALSPLQMEEYIEMAAQLAFMERLKAREQKEAEQKRKLERNPLYRLAYMCGLV